ncbi:MAG: BrnT family toxin [Pseudomonadota bacterium]
MEFEFDRKKSEANKSKHGIDFVEAQALWDGEMTVLRVRIEPEPRFIVIGLLDGRHWTAIVTYRKDVTRIISVRRSRKEEVQIHGAS